MQEKLLLRAKARAALRANGGPPSLAIKFVAPPQRDAAGTPMSAPIPSGTHTAMVRAGGRERTFTRGAKESSGAFERRVRDELPVVRPGMVIFLPA